MQQISPLQFGQPLIKAFT